MHTRSRKVSQVTRSIFSSVLLLQQMAALSPALANVPHDPTPVGPAPYHPNLTGALLGNHGGWHSGAPGIGTSGTSTAGDSAAGNRTSQYLPASFGVGVASLPLAKHSLPLVQHASNRVQNAAGSKTVSQPVETVQLDLTSSASTIVLAQGVIKQGSSVTIDVGGTSTTFHTGDKVTAGELVAIEQAQSGGQTLQLDGQGRASGGTFSLTSVTSNSGSISVASVVVPKNVTAIDQVSAKSSLSLSGDLTNYGSIDEIAKGSQSASANLSALDIVNEPGGLITSVGAGKGAVDLNLSAGNDFTNQGTITSSGALSIAAGGTLKNTAGSSDSGISAVKDVTLQSANIINSGTVASSAGNVNLTASNSQDLNVNNNGGTISALSGAINVRDAGYNGSGNTTITGGNLLSQELNLNAGNGTTNVDVDQLTGTVASAGNAVHVQARTEDLVLGAQNLSGDPTYYNDTGSIQITGDIVVTEALAIIASGSVTATNGLTQITATNAGVGQNITIVAGANITSGSGSTNTIATTPPVVGNATSSVTFNGASKTGGDIDLSGASSTLSISSASSASNIAGANVTLAAFSVSGAGGGGHILLPASSNIDASGNGTGANGNVTLIAGAQDGNTAISINTVQHGGGAGAANLQLFNVQPISSDLKQITFDIHGVLTSGNSIGADFTQLGNGDILVGGALNATGPINISAGDNATLSAGATTTAALTITAAQANINFNSTLTAPNGILLVAAHNITATGAANLLTDNAGNGGNIIVAAGANFSETLGSLQIIGASVPGGTINFTNVSTINTTSTSKGSGGNIELAAYFDGDPNGGEIITPNAAISTGGIGAINSNGNVNFNAGQNSSGNTAITAPTSINVSGTSTVADTGSVSLNTTQPLGAITIAKPAVTITGGQFEGGAVAAGQEDLNGLGLTMSGANAQFLGGGIIVGGVSIFGSINELLMGGTDITINTTFAPAFNVNFLNVIALGSITIKSGVQAGSICMSAAGGNINFFNSTEQIVAPGGITMVANGSIVGPGSVPSFSTASAGNAGNITLVAGASFISTVNTITIGGPNIAGGSIDLPNTTSLTASSTGGKGGNVTLAAFDATPPNFQGEILLGNPMVITTGGAAGFSNGNVVVVSGTGLAVDGIGSASNPLSINTTGGLTGTGNISISNSSPNVSPSVLIDRPSATITTGSFLGNPVAGGIVTIGSLNFDGSSVAIQGGQINLIGTMTGTGNSALTVDCGSQINIHGLLNTTGSASFTALTSIDLFNSLTASGGLSMVAGLNIETFASGLTISTAQAGNAGNVTMVAGATFNLTGNLITITGANASGGIIELGSNPISSFTANSTGTGSGGNVTLVAFGDPSVPGQGSIDLPTAATITTGGASGGANGNVVVVAGEIFNATAIGTNSSFLSANTTGGLVGTGSIALANSAPNTAINEDINRSTGAVTTGNFLGGAVEGGQVYAGKLAVDSSTISIEAGNLVNLGGNINASGTSVLTVDSSAANVTIAGNINCNSASFTSGTNITIQGNISAPGGLTMVAGSNIASGPGGPFAISTNSSTGNAGDITMVAGAAFSSLSGTITVTGPNASNNGGFIDFATFPISQLSAQSNVLTGSGGDITLVSFASSGGSNAQVAVASTTTIKSGGGSLGNNGDVVIVSGNNVGQTAIGNNTNPINIDTTGGVAGTGNITLSISTPNTTPPVTINRANAVVTGSFLGGPTTNGTANIGTLTTDGATVTIVQGGGAFNVTGPIATGSNLVIDSSSTINVNAALTNNSLTLLTPLTININANMAAPGGMLLVAGGNIQTQTNGVDISTASSTGNAGNMTIVAGALFSLSGSSVTITGASGSSGNGNVDLNSFPIGSLTTASSVFGGGGGNMTIAAFANGAGSGQVLIGPTALTISSSGGTFGPNGNITIVGGATSGAAINVPNIDPVAVLPTGAILLQSSAPTVGNSNPNLVVASGANAGTIASGGVAANFSNPNAASITAGNITTPLSIVVNGGAGVSLGNLVATFGPTGSAGSVSVTCNSSSGTPLTVGSSGANNILSINVSGGGTSGSAGQVSLQNSGSGGITLLAGGLIDTVVSGNGAIISLNAGNAGALTLPGNSLSVNGAGSTGSGGMITLNANTITWTNVGTQDLLLSANAFSTGSGIGGTIQVTLASNTAVTVGSGASDINMSATAGSLGGSGGTVILTANNAPLTVDGTAINVAAAGSNGVGGTISLTGTSITAANAATQPLVLTATGTGNGNGGTIILSALTSALTVGTANGNVELIANSGSGSGGAGGVIDVSAGTNLTVNPLGIVAGPAGTNGNGAQLNLSAGGSGPGNLIVSSTLSANGAGTGIGGEITLISNSGTASFTIGSAKTNGVVGLSVRGTTNGSITVANLGGSITQTVAVTAIDSATYAAGGSAGSVTVSSSLGDPSTSSISLSAAGTGSVTGTGLLTASGVTLSSGTGAIGGKTALKLASQDITANGGGQVNLTDSMGATLFGSGSTNSSFALSAAGNISTGGSVTASTTVSLITTATNGSISIGGQVGSATATLATVTAKGTGSITDQIESVFPIEATTVNLTTTSGSLGSGANPLEVQATSLSALTTGNVNISNIGTGTLTLTGGKSTNAFTVFSAGNINTGKVALTSASVINFITTANNGNIAVGASQGGTKTLGITLQAEGSGAITEVKGVKLTTTSTVNMVSTSGSIGTAALPMVEVAPSISFNTGGTGAVFATNSYTKATTLQNSSAGDGFTLTSGTGGLTVNSISTTNATGAGNITLTATGGAITTVAATTQSTADGGITINNTSTKGTITFGANSTVSSLAGAGAGQIEIVVGKLPPPQVAGSLPTNVAFGVNSTPGDVFFNSGLTASAPNNTVSGINTKLIFSAPSATLIKLDGGVTITADPPASAPASSVITIGATRSSLDRIVLPAIMAGQNEEESSSSLNTTSPSVLTISAAENATTQNPALMTGTLGSNSGVPYLTANSALPSSLLYSQDGTRTYFTGAPTRAGWISDTELETGKIPAAILGDVANALDDGNKSYADIEVANGGVVQNGVYAAANNAATKQSLANPSESALIGGISRNVKVIHAEKSDCRKSNLKKGSVLIASSTDSVINTPLGEVSVAARSLALVMSFAGGVAVFNLDDSHRDAVSISVGGSKISLAPGKSVVIASDATKSFDRINPAQLICYQGVTEHVLGNGMKAFKAEFSLPSAINAVAPLKALLQSNHPEAKRICGHLLKTTSIVMQLRGGFDNFRQIRKPQLTAYMQ
jgi:fibronectin-binding autotransporter adhesin